MAKATKKPKGCDGCKSTARLFPHPTPTHCSSECWLRGFPRKAIPKPVKHASKAMAAAKTLPDLRDRYLVFSCDTETNQVLVDLVVAVSSRGAKAKVRTARPTAIIDSEPELLDEYIKYLIDLLAQPLDHIEKGWEKLKP